MSLTVYTKHSSLIAYLFLILLVFQQAPKTARSDDLSLKDQTILMQADQIIHENHLNLITAKGSVELSQKNRILLADEISFSQNTGEVTATGNVTLLESSGEVLFSDAVKLTNDFKHGFIKNLKLLMKDGSRLAANSAELLKDGRKVMKRAIFSPCLPCKEHPEESLIWQIKADQIIHNEKTQNMEYNNATLEFFDFPVFYTPYFLHPDSTVKRRSGLLTPTQGYSDDKGFIYGQPYFFAIDRARDVEIEPTIYSRDGLTLQSRYRHAFYNGALDLKTTAGIISEPSSSSDSERIGFKGSIDFKGEFSLNETWRSTLNIEQSSNKNFLRKYLSDDKEMLTSNILLEGFRSRNYFAMNAYKFQGLRVTDDKQRQPIVLPELQYNLIDEPDDYGGRFQMSSLLTSISREVGADSKKLSVLTGWKLPHYSSAGEIYTLTAMLQSDLYYTNNQEQALDKPPQRQNHTIGRVFPQLALNWRYPFLRTVGVNKQVLEPIVNFVIGPNVGAPEKIPNEDSQAFEFDDTNIFNLNRYDGNDRITGGSRIDFGIKGSMFNEQIPLSEIFIGQSYRFSGNDNFAKKSGLNDDFSDFVGRAIISSSDWIDFVYRFRIDKDTLAPKRSEFGLNLLSNKYNFLIDYILLDEQSSTETFGNREQLDLKFNVQIDELWSGSIQLVQDLTNDTNKTRKASLGLIYSDECFTVGIEYQRTNLSHDDIKPEDQVFLLINLKNLGSF